MSTRGLFGFVINGEVKAGYNHSDSYPSWLGANAVGAIKSGELDRDKIASIVMVDEATPATAEQVASFTQYSNTNVGSGITGDWYVLLRELQGDWLGVQKAGYMIDSYDFAGDSLFCEWGYLINMDSLTLEVYKGFNKNEPVGRFADLKIDEHRMGYKQITLVGEYSFDDLPDMNELESSLEEDEDD